jgi:hypothetical protein
MEEAEEKVVLCKMEEAEEEEEEEEEEEKVCKSCGSSGHKSIYSKTCPNHVPLSDRARCTCVPMSLAGRLRDKRCLEVINNALDAFHTLRYFSSLLILGHAARVMSLSQRPPEITGSYLRMVWTLLRSEKCRVKSESTTPTTELLETARQLNLPKTDGTGLADLLSANLSLLLKDYTNFDEGEIIQAHVALYVRAKYDIGRGHGSAIAEKVVRKKPGKFRTLPKTLEGSVTEWNERINELHAEYIRLAHEWVTVKKKGQDKRVLEVTPVSLQQYRYHMMQFITVKNTQLQESGADYTYKQIKLLPTAAAGRKFVNFDNAAVKSLHSRLQLACPELQATTTTETGKRRKDGTPVTREVKYNQLDTCFESLDSLFILYDKMAKNKNKWKPSRSVKTNGIELHVLYETLNTKRLDSGPRKGQIQK